MSSFTILLAEDSALMRHLVREMLRTIGEFHIVETANGQQALEVLRSSRKVDLVLSDRRMAPMDGMQLLHAMRADPALTGIPFVMFSGEQTPHCIAETVKAGVAGYLTKPFDTTQLASQIARVRSGQMTASF